MPRNLVLYVLAGLAGLLVYFVLRSLLGAEIMFVLVLIGLVAGGVIVWRNLQTNRKVADATPEQRAEALAFAPVAGKTALYVFRNQFVGRAVGINVLIDGREVTQLHAASGCARRAPHCRLYGHEQKAGRRRRSCLHRGRRRSAGGEVRSRAADGRGHREVCAVRRRYCAGGPRKDRADGRAGCG